MAKFEEVLKQFKRMCKNEECSNCDINRMMKEGNYPSCWAMAYEEPTRFEGYVMLWAKQHPEPHYPTMIEWLEDNKYIYKDYDPIDFTDKAHEPIPGGLAEKLGLKLKEEEPKVSGYGWE